MTRDTAKELVRLYGHLLDPQWKPILEAFGEGKVIQMDIGQREWIDYHATDGMGFGGAVSRYRVKPEPREVWGNEYFAGKAVELHQTRELADSYADKRRIALIRFVEAERIEVK